MPEGYLFGTGPQPQPQDSWLRRPREAAQGISDAFSAAAPAPGMGAGMLGAGGIPSFSGAPMPNASAAVSSAPLAVDRSFADPNFQWSPHDFGVRQQAGLNPAQQLGAAETNQPNETYTPPGATVYEAPGGSITSFPGRGANGTKGLSGAEWLKSAQSDPNHAWHNESQGRWTGSSDNLGLSPERTYDIGSQDPEPNEPFGARSAFGSGAGNGTGADYLGRIQQAGMESALHSAQDPFQEQRIKGEYAVRAQMGPALIGAQSAQGVANTRAQADRDVANLQGQNATTKEEAQYASFDALVDQQLNVDIQDARQKAIALHQAGNQNAEQLFQKKVFDLQSAARAQKQQIREFGVGGRPNPLEAIYGNVGGQRQPVPNPQQ